MAIKWLYMALFEVKMLSNFNLFSKNTKIPFRMTHLPWMSIWIFTVLLSYHSLAAIYVSPTGDDANSGTQIKPLKSLAAAQNRLRSMTVDERIAILREGIYLLEKPLEFDERDNGTEGNPAQWEAYPGESPVITTLTEAKSWSVYKGSIYRCDIPKGRPFYTLLENNQRMQWARWPNNVAPGENDSKAWLKAESQDEKDFSINIKTADLPSGWNSKGVSVLLKHPWWILQYPLASVTGNTLMLEPNEFPTASQGQPLADTYALMGDLRFLDEPGEFYVDEEKGYLYYWPIKTPISEQKILYTSSSRLFVFKGKTSSQRVQHIKVSRLHFYGSDFGKAFDRNRREGAVVFENADHITLERCVIEKTGCNGVLFHHWSQKNNIRQCVFRDIGMAAVNLIGYWLGEGTFNSAVEANVNKNNTIEDCSFEEISRLILSEGAIQISQSGNNIIRNNRFKRSGRYCVAMGGQMRSWMKESYWGENVTDQNYRNFLFSRNNFIGYNDGFDHRSELNEGSAFNFWGVGVGNILEGNLVANTGTTGIYLDDASDSSIVRKNILLGPMETKGIGIQIYDNIFFGALTFSQIRSSSNSNRIKRNIFVNSCDREWCGDGFYNAEEKQHPNVVVESDSNCFFHTKAIYKWLGFSWDEWRKFQNGKFDTHSVVGDPLFVDVANRNFTLKPNSPALKIGFQSLDQKLCGPRTVLPESATEIIQKENRISGEARSINIKSKLQKVLQFNYHGSQILVRQDKEKEVFSVKGEKTHSNLKVEP